MHLICINYSNIINKLFFGKKKGSNTLHICLDIHAKFRSDWPLWGRDLKGVTLRIFVVRAQPELKTK